MTKNEDDDEDGEENKDEEEKRKMKSTKEYKGRTDSNSPTGSNGEEKGR